MSTADSLTALQKHVATLQDKLVELERRQGEGLRAMHERLAALEQRLTELREAQSTLVMHLNLLAERLHRLEAS